MNALDAISRLANTSIPFANFRWCFVDESKQPYCVDGTPARTNAMEDFVEFESLLSCKKIERFAGVGISIQASNVCAIDVDDCFATANDINSADERAKLFVERFKSLAYCEFSFSGRGLRILFRQPLIDDYSSKYYIKNKTHKIEFYQPSKSFRYVTLTGNAIADNVVDNNETAETCLEMLDMFMARNVKTKSETVTQAIETRSLDELMKLIRIHQFRNTRFQSIWFSKAPGSGRDESERDYFLLAYIFENITQDKELMRQIFESSEFFKSKDSKHAYKWTYNNHRYYEYLYDTIKERHL